MTVIKSKLYFTLIRFFATMCVQKQEDNRRCSWPWRVWLVDRRTMMNGLKVNYLTDHHYGAYTLQLVVFNNNFFWSIFSTVKSIHDLTLFWSCWHFIMLRTLDDKFSFFGMQWVRDACLNVSCTKIIYSSPNHIRYNEPWRWHRERGTLILRL